MKTKEFIEQLIELGFIIEKMFGNIVVYKDGCEIALVEPDKMYGIVSGINDYQEMSSETQRKLFNLLVEYASTPIEERKEEKKYQFKFVNFGNNWNYLSRSSENGRFYMDCKTQVGTHQTEFIDSEVSQFPAWVHDLIEHGHLVREEKKTNE